MAEIVAKRLVEHLERAGFVVMKRPARVGGAALGRGFEGEQRKGRDTAERRRRDTAECSRCSALPPLTKRCPTSAIPSFFVAGNFATSDTYLDPEIIVLRVLRHRILRRDYR